jgi:hypothetical protein
LTHEYAREMEKGKEIANANIGPRGEQGALKMAPVL